MAINTEKNTYTLLFAIGLVVIVGTLLAAIDASLKDKIRVNKTLEKQQNIFNFCGSCCLWWECRIFWSLIFEKIF